MKIVIDITEEDYKKATDHLKIFNEKALNEPFMNATLRDRVEIALLRGTPLPKNHGRLIDADAFIAMLKDATERQRYKELLIDDCLTVDDVIKAIIESLQNEGLAEGDAPTIIPAESEEE